MLGVMTDKTPPPQVWPALRARDARALIRFLVDAFGFEEVVVYGDGDRVEHAQLRWPPGGGIMLGSVREADSSDSWPVQPGTFAAYVVTDDPDGLHARRAGQSGTGPVPSPGADLGRGGGSAAAACRRASASICRVRLTACSAAAS